MNKLNECDCAVWACGEFSCAVAALNTEAMGDQSEWDRFGRATFDLAQKADEKIARLEREAMTETEALRAAQRIWMQFNKDFADDPDKAKTRLIASIQVALLKPPPSENYHRMIGDIQSCRRWKR